MAVQSKPVLENTWLKSILLMMFGSWRRMVGTTIATSVILTIYEMMMAKLKKKPRSSRSKKRKDKGDVSTS